MMMTELHTTNVILGLICVTPNLLRHNKHIEEPCAKRLSLMCKSVSDVLFDDKSMHDKMVSLVASLA